jgi:hypothetical protein
MSIFFIFTTFDMASRSNVMKMSGTFEFRQDRADANVAAGNVVVPEGIVAIEDAAAASGH